MLEPIQERALLIVVDRLVRDGEDVVGAEGRQRGVSFAGRLLKALELLSHLKPRAEPRGLAPERLGNEPARARGALVAVVDRAREIEGVLRSCHGHVGETALFGDMPI